MKVHSLNIGRPQLLSRDGRTVKSAINRKPVDGPVRVESLGFTGDEQASKKHHGGPDRAVCCYPHEHYPYFREKLGEKLGDPLDVPAFGENLTTEGLLESEVCLGDVYRIGTAVFQISQPRQPCSTLALRNGSTDLPKWINEKGYTGFYLRIIEPGEVRPGDEIRLLGRCHNDVTIHTLMQAMLNKQTPREVLARLIGLPELSQSWKDTFTQRLAALDGRPVEDSD